MAKPKPKPIAGERSFSPSELFFSTTDKRGIILAGNDVFQRISGYEFAELRGAPHNIIRHPDMPKIVFKVLWDTISQGEMIAAYVKNMAADGKFYWVLAMVFPVGEQYLSIRLKPSTALKAAAESIYASVLTEEATNGVEASAKVLFTALAGAGFKTYQEFMTAAILAEIRARDEFVLGNPSEAAIVKQNSKHRELSEALANILKVSEETAGKYRALFVRIGEFDKSRKQFHAQVEHLLTTFSKFQLLSLNMRVFSAQIGIAGASLGVVAENFQNLVDGIQSYLRSFSEMVDGLCENIEKLSLQTACLKVQMDMVDFFVQGSLKRAMTADQDFDSAFCELEQHGEMFLTLSKSFHGKALLGLSNLKESIDHFSASNKEIRKFVNGIELISQVGAVEAARLVEARQDFAHYIKSMNEFSQVLRESTQVIVRSTGDLADNVSVIERHFRNISGSMSEVFKFALALKKKAA